MGKTEIVIHEDETGRLDVILSKRLNLTRSFAQQIIDNGNVTASGRILKKNYRPAAGESVFVVVPEPKPLEVKAQDIPLDIVYEDEHVIVINKRKGMVVHPACGNWDGTLVNALLNHCGDGLSGINGMLRPGIVHRLDKDTSGLMIAAKTDPAHRILARQIKEKSIHREYHAVVIGNLGQDSDVIDAPIGRHKTNRKKMCITAHNSRPAVTRYRVIERFPGYTYVSCVLETGRTHQIRVHMSGIGHPLVGDYVYGARDKFNTNGQCLHSICISFRHPVTDEEIILRFGLPDYFNEVLSKLRSLK